MKRTTGQGLGLRGDGFARARSRIEAAGFETVTAYVESHPTASLLEIADELNRSDADSDSLPVAADHLALMWRKEALEGDEKTFLRFALRALVGEIHSHLPTGWPENSAAAPPFALTHIAVTWIAIIGHDLESRATDVWIALLDSRPPTGWLPESADDRLVAMPIR